MIEFFESVVGTFRITQPGSSVATSLVAGEAARKKVGILDINGKNFRLHPVPLTQVRSFVTTELSLREHRANLDAEDPKVDAKVTQVLEEEVRLMILNAREKTQELIEDARLAGSDTTDDNCSLKYRILRPDEVLVRVRVEHMGFSTLNNQRFGAKFVGQVANANDILLFHRKKDPKLASTVVKRSIQPIAPEELERTNMEDLVKEHLEAPERKLKLLEEKELCEAMEDYVEKSIVAAIQDKANGLLKKKQMKLIKAKDQSDQAGDSCRVADILDDSREDSLENDVSNMNDSVDDGNKRKRLDTTVERSHEISVDMAIDSDDDTNPPVKPVSRNKRASPRAAARVPVASGRKTATQRREIDVSSEDEGNRKTAKRQPAARPQRANARKVKYSADNNSSDEEVSDEIIEENDDDSIEVVQKPVGRKSTVSRKTAPSMRQRSTSGTAQKKTPKRTARRQKYDDSDDDDDLRNKGATDDLDDDWGTAATSSQY